MESSAHSRHLEKSYKTNELEKGFVTANDGEGCPASKRAPGASKAIIGKYLSPFYEIGQNVTTCFEDGRVQRPELKTVGADAASLAILNTEYRDIDLCRRTPVLPSMQKDA